MYIALKFFLLLVLIFSFIFFHAIIGFFAIIPFWIICGLIDVSRHKTMDLKLLNVHLSLKKKMDLSFLTLLIT